MTVATISNYEKGVHSPDYETLIKLADFFDVSTDYLLQRTDYRASITLLNKPLIPDFTVSDLLNTVMTLDQRNLKALLDYYELLTLRNTMQRIRNGEEPLVDLLQELEDQRKLLSLPIEL